MLSKEEANGGAGGGGWRRKRGSAEGRRIGNDVDYGDMTRQY